MRRVDILFTDLSVFVPTETNRKVIENSRRQNINIHNSRILFKHSILYGIWILSNMHPHRRMKISQEFLETERILTRRGISCTRGRDWSKPKYCLSSSGDLYFRPLKFETDKNTEDRQKPSTDRNHQLTGSISWQKPSSTERNYGSFTPDGEVNKPTTYRAAGFHFHENLLVLGKSEKSEIDFRNCFRSSLVNLRKFRKIQKSQFY